MLPNPVKKFLGRTHKSLVIPRKGLAQDGDSNVFGKANNYRHGQYKITEIGTGYLFWQCHFGFGSYREGRCYFKGDILFFGPAENEGIGFLIGEFIDSIKRLPPWTKTRLYCDHISIIDCSTDKMVSINEMRSWANYSNTEDTANDCKTNNFIPSHIGYLKSHPLNRLYRLGNYELAINDNNLISWKLPIGGNSISFGNGLILEDILFLGVADFKKQERGVRAQQLARLEGLPRWHITKYYSKGHPPFAYSADHETGKKITPSQAITNESGTKWLAFLSRTIISWAEVIAAKLAGKPSIIAKTLLDFMLSALRGFLSKSSEKILAIWNKLLREK